MLQLLKPIDFTQKLLQNQKYVPGINYRFAYYCLILNKTNDVLIYNNLTREYLILTKKEYAQLIESKYSMPKKLASELVEKWFLVPENNDDYVLCQQIRNLFRTLYTSKSIAVHNFNILTTTSCNARCFYCYQAGTAVKTMEHRTAIDVANYIIKKSNDKTVQICWFGGEPLCNIDAIDTICGYLNEKNKNFYSAITSNGYLFDKKLVEKAKNYWHLKKAQITLDGTSDIYLKIKNYKNNDTNAFYKVIDNISYLLENDIRVEIRLNMDNHNYNDLHSLIYFLSKKFAAYDNFLTYVRPIYENVGFNKISHNESSRIDIVQKFNELRNQIKNQNLFGSANLIRNYRIHACQADDDAWRLILPDGKFAFCEHFLDNDSFGSIYDDAKKPVWSNYCSIEEKCKTCPAYIDCIKNAKCPESQHGCYDYEQIMRIDRIYQGMENEYSKYIANKE